MTARKSLPGSARALYTPHFFIKLVREGEAMGIPAARLLHGTGVDPRRLHDANTRVTLQQTLQLATNARRLAGRSDLGLSLGSCTQPNDGGLVSVAATASGDFWEKARLNERFHRLSGQIMVPRWLREGEMQLCRLQAPQDLGALLPFFVEEGFSTLMSAINGNYQGRFTPTELRLAYAHPPHHLRYAALFRCPVRFDMPHNEFVGNFLALPVSRRAAHPLNFTLCQRLCEEMDQRTGVAEQVSALLLQHGEALTMGEVAARLGTTARTLARRLETQGLSYRELKDEARLTRAAQLLQHTRMSVDAVAEATGFRSTRRFRDFFVRHQGLSPSRYRRAGADDSSQARRRSGLSRTRSSPNEFGPAVGKPSE